MSELVVGTAGHIDHGKTALIKALTGVDCDRLDEERRRGMTIELGFAPWTLPSGREVSVVDVPGHERFIRTMAVGARSIDLALLCVAADDGVMPQTEEHAAILRILMVRRTVVAVTKVDLAPHRVEMVGSQSLSLLRDVGIAARRWVGVNVVQGVGLTELATTVDSELGEIEDHPDRGCPRLLVDRSFSKAGVGTVVTGVLDDGQLHHGDGVEVFPTRKRGRIQGLQRRGHPVTTAHPGGRLALALKGVSVKDVPRGSVIGLVGAVRPSSRVDCLLQIPKLGASGVRQGMTVEVLHGTATVQAQLWLAGEDRLPPGCSGYGQLQLRSPLWVLPGDRFILRAPRPAAVVGGGLALDAQPARHRRWWSAPLDSWAVREQALSAGLSRGAGQLAVLEASSAPLGLEVGEAARRAGATLTSARTAMDAALEEGTLIRLEKSYLARSTWDQIVQRTRVELLEHEESHPLERGLSRRQLLLRLGFDAGADGDAVVGRLAAAGVLEARGPLVRRPGTTSGGHRSPAVERTAALLRRAGVDAPGALELKQAGLSKAVAGYLVRSGEAVQLGSDVLISSAALEGLEARLQELLADSPDGLTVAALRDQLHTTRRVMVPLLERLARLRVTERVGDRHRLRSLPQGASPCA
ncbi:MAG TPA: selenocysteine-specific translation elongation factor [Candidatus Dormibacteraeota bacterium]|nr:selenocysteine-specific translation elongation factor [Candidatus Dormibacteraeota bacterium]